MRPSIDISTLVPAGRRSRAATVAALVVVLAAGAWAGLVAARGSSLTPRDRYWQQDIAYLAAELPKVHADQLTGGVTRSKWDTAAARLEAQVPRLSSGQIIAGMARMIAPLRDDETEILPTVAPQYPLVWFWVGSGLYALAVPAADGGLLGGRLVAVDGHPIRHVLALLAPTIDGEDPGFVAADEAKLLQNPAWLADLGVVRSVASAQFTLQVPSGRVVTARIGSVGRGGALRKMPPIRTVPVPLYLQHQNEPYWMTVLGARHAVYLKYNQCLDNDGFQRLAARALALLRAHPAYRLILDLRDNGGGTTSPVQTLITWIRSDPSLDRRGRVLVLIDGNDFSSASFDPYLLQTEANAVLIGQPTAEQADTYGNDSELRLPHFGVKVGYTTAVVNMTGARLGIPNIYLAPTLQDWLTGSDPVLAAALAYRS